MGEMPTFFLVRFLKCYCYLHSNKELQVSLIFLIKINSELKNRFQTKTATVFIVGYVKMFLFFPCRMLMTVLCCGPNVFLLR